MAYIQKVTPPPNRVLTLSLKNFVGGLDNRSEVLQPNQASALMNMRFYDETVMDNRYGQKYYDAVALDAPVVFIDEFKPYNDVNVLVRATSGKLYINNAVLTTIAGKPTGTNHNGKYFFADGDKIYCYGRFAQVTDVHTKVIGTPINDYVLLEVISPADGHPQLDTSYTTGVLNVDYTNYRVFYEPCANEFADNYLGANKVPISTKYIASHIGRLFVSGANKDDDNVFITHIQNPFYFPVSLPMQLPPNSDQIKGMAIYDDSVVVGRGLDIFAIHGSTNRPNMGVSVFELKRINSHTGFANNDSVRVANNYLFFLGSDGNAYALASTKADERLLATTILTKNIDITKPPINLLKSDITNSCSVFFEDEWLLNIANMTLVYSYRQQEWTIYNNVNARYFYVIDNTLIWGRDDGRTATWDEDTFLDFGTPYQSYWYSKAFDMDEANNYKQYRDFFIVAHVFENHPSDVNITFEIDYDDVKGRVVIANRISVWGTAKWGDRFITRNISESVPFTIGRRGRNIRFKFSCSYDLDGSVATYSDLANYPAKRDGLLVYVTGENKYYLYMDMAWTPHDASEFNQRMRIYQVNGDYELRGKR